MKIRSISPEVTESSGFLKTLHIDLDSVRNVYDRYAAIYDWYFGHLMHFGRKAVVARMHCRPGDKILEVGVGTGLSLDLYPHSVQLTGIDISSQMLERARKRKERLGLEHVVSLREMDAERMQFPDNSFDRVAAIYVASVVPHPIRLVNEMRRVCKPDGELYFLNHFHSRQPLLARLERMLAPLSSVLGFRPDLCLDTFIRESELEVIEEARTNLFGYWRILRARNNKKVSPEPISVRATPDVAEQNTSLPLLLAGEDSQVECLPPVN
jgi:phosphatidylethanolamine/phosphatidyl-N-methylethanolamine N-methyltransferase